MPAICPVIFEVIVLARPRDLTLVGVLNQVNTLLIPPALANGVTVVDTGLLTSVIE